MDELQEFFNNPCPSSAQVVKLRGPLTGGFRITKDDPIDQYNRRENHRQAVVPSGTDYARVIKEKEKEAIKDAYKCRTYDSIPRGLESLEHLSSLGQSTTNIKELTEEAMTEVYSKYTAIKRSEQDKKLPICEYEQQIIDRIHAFPVVIIEGPTGCGKTTQVPQWILEDCYKNRKPCKIVVTQPRRIAAISIAKRVAQERGWDVGGLVGYQVGLENRTTTDTRIHYVTTGVLLQKLVAAKTMSEYTHIVLDEVHERGQEMDFLLLVVKKFLTTVSLGVKVILMSATFNRDVFADYFPMAHCFKVDKADSPYPVKTFYLNDLSKFGTVLLDAMPKDEPGIKPEMHHMVIKLINAFEHIDMQEEHIKYRETAELPSVLIFLPGINEIEELFLNMSNLKLREKLTDAQCKEYKWWVLPLHSTITAEEQVRVFQRAPPGQRKIILATNIAESSITVPDVKYVIDFCLMKILVADENTNFTSLQLSWASKTNCEQRAGRAGRVREGRVYRLVPDKFYENLKQECDPEIMRCPLERLVLLAKMLDMGPPSDVLALAMDPPDLSNIHRTLLVLKEMGALKKTYHGEWNVADGDMTYLGRIMAKLPLDVRASKLIVLGHIFGCLEESIIIAAAMSVKNIFSSPFLERLNAYNSKLTWADGSTSDCIAFLNVYRVWNHLRKQQYFKQANHNELQWAKRFYVQVRALRELDDLVRELKMRLSREGIEVTKGPSHWYKNEQTFALKIIMAGAVYPQYFVQVSQDEARERDAVRALGGLNPRDTVYLQNFPDNQPGEVYAAAIRKVVREKIGDDPRVTFDSNSRKVFLTFGDNMLARRRDNSTSNDPTIPGQVVLPVYKAIKTRQLKMDIRICLLPVEQAHTLAEKLREEKMGIDIQRMVPRLPDIDDSYIPLKISEFITVSKFWAQYDDQSTTDDLEQIQMELNQSKLLANTGRVTPGDMFAAPYVDRQGTTIHRARVLKLLPSDMVEVLFVDYGSVSRMGVCNLMVLPPGICWETQPLAMQCRLAEIAPSPLLDQHAQWTDAATRLFTNLVNLGHLMGKVYSVVHGVVAIELLVEGGRKSVNRQLVDNKLAVPSEESYESKMNHDLRQTATELDLAQRRAFNREQTEMAFWQLREIDPPKKEQCISDVCLKGPFSPLETVVHNLMYASRDKQVNIEWNSVNSVLLDTEPQEVYERLLIAAEVGQNEISSKLTLRHTTLMPNIPALPAIIALLFCPVSELRRDVAGTRYVSALCGLGSTDNGTPYFPEHDVLVNIDADLDVNDIGTINHVRHLMDFMLYCGEGEDVPAENEFRAQVPKTIRSDILKLFHKRRTHREPQVVANAWEWKSVPENELLEITIEEMTKRSVIYHLHSPLELKPLLRDQVLALHKDNEQLKMLVNKSAMASSMELTCKLCNTTPMSAQAMRIHLYSNGHKDREHDLRSVRS